MTGARSPRQLRRPADKQDRGQRHQGERRRHDRPRCNGWRPGSPDGRQGRRHRAAAVSRHSFLDIRSGRKGSPASRETSPSGQRCTLHHTDEVVADDARPSLALRTGRPSSMRLAIEAVADGRADGVVSAGNTGALMAIAKFVLKMLPGIDRPAIASFFPPAAAKA